MGSKDNDNLRVILSDEKLIKTYLTKLGIKPVDKYYYSEYGEFKEQYKNTYVEEDIFEYMKRDMDLFIDDKEISIHLHRYAILDRRTGDIVYNSHRKSLIDKEMYRLEMECKAEGIEIGRNTFGVTYHTMSYPYTAVQYTVYYGLDLNTTEFLKIGDNIHISGMATVCREEEYTVETQKEVPYGRVSNIDDRETYERVEITIPDVFRVDKKKLFEKKLKLSEYLKIN